MTKMKEATAKIGCAKTMDFAVDLNQRQYEALHDGRHVPDLHCLPKDEFVIEKVGQTDQRQFQDVGIEYYRYVG